MTEPYGKPFLTAEWRYVAMLNYEIDPAILHTYLPRRTELDSWNGKTFVSMVGFLFLKTRVLGLPIPFHQNFEEINLRFYVRRKTEEGWRRGVVFIKEIVPRAAIALTARWLYNENYVALPTGNVICWAAHDAKKYRVGEVLLDVSQACTVRRSRNAWHCKPFRRRLGRRVYRSALLGLFKAERWRDDRISRRAPSVADLASSGFTIGLRR